MHLVQDVSQQDVEVKSDVAHLFREIFNMLDWGLWSRVFITVTAAAHASAAAARRISFKLGQECALELDCLCEVEKAASHHNGGDLKHGCCL